VKIIISVILFLNIAILIFSAEITTELKYQGFDTEKQDFEDITHGRITVKDYENEDYSFFLEYKFGEGADRIDAGQIKFIRSKIDLEIGRNRIGWGTGYNFNPTDIFNDVPLGSAYDPTFIKNGRDSIILTRYIGDNSLQGVYAAKDGSTIDEDFAFKYKTSFSDFDGDLLYIHKGERTTDWDELEKKDDIIGGDLSFSIPDLDYGIWLEGAYYLTRDDLVYILGIDNYFGEKYHVMLEYLYHGLGEDSEEDYNINRIFAEELAGKNYLMPSITYEYSEKTLVTGYLFMNMDDYSYSVGATFTYLYNDHIDISLIPFYINGKDGSEYGILANEVGKVGVNFIIRAVF
jgi:hypothetical protein